MEIIGGAEAISADIRPQAGDTGNVAIPAPGHLHLNMASPQCMFLDPGSKPELKNWKIVLPDVSGIFVKCR